MGTTGRRSLFTELRAGLGQALAQFRIPDPRQKSASSGAADSSLEIPLRPEWLISDLEFPIPDWRLVGEWIEAQSPEQHNALWTAVARRWATHLAKAFGGCNVFETANILAVLPGDIGRGKRAVRHYEETLHTLRSALGDMALPSWYGKFLLLIAPDRDLYYRYHSAYCAPGEHIASGGVYLNRGYGHIVIPSPDSMFATRVIAHELCHALLVHHTLPLWLNEGVTQITEAAVAGRPLTDHSTKFADHRAFWTPANIGNFWDGRSFDIPGDVSALSYDLAYLVVGAFLRLDRKAMATVVMQAKPDDSSFAAFSAAYGQTPADLLAEMFGPGDWGNGHRTTLVRSADGETTGELPNVIEKREGRRLPLP